MIDIIRLLPPQLIKGAGIPLVGSAPEITPIFIIACIVIISWYPLVFWYSSGFINDISLHILQSLTYYTE